MFFDGACSKDGNGAGVIFVFPEGKTFRYSFLLSFECTNNIVEYEVEFDNQTWDKSVKLFLEILS